MKVAIVGAGISGLLTAYLLKQKQPNASITIFEKASRLGGNAYTANFDVGQPVRSSIRRWADLGVNDFNTVTYKNIIALMDKLGVAYRPLEDSTSFSTLDGSIAYVIDPGYKAGTGDATNMPVSVQRGFDNFSQQAPIDVQNPLFAEFSIADYLQYRNENPPKGTSGNDNFYPADFIHYNLYPRVNGMYFVHDTVPSTMSFAGIMHYYSLQEGFGSGPPNRVYLTKGTQAWINALSQELLNQGISLQTGTSVQVFGRSDGVEIFQESEGYEPFDTVVMACHASTALKLIQQGITNDMVKVLSKFDYYNSLSVAHTYTPPLPPDRNTWRTYNILIHGNYAQLRPYTISYVCNRHQNDAANPKYDHFGQPEYFVSLDPAIPIPDQYVLKQLDQTPAITNFTHNIVSTDTISAQSWLWGTHDSAGIQGQNCIYFTGGWTLGAGLHEECYHSADQVSNLITGLPLDADLFYTPHAEPENYAPHYLREAILDIEIKYSY